MKFPPEFVVRTQRLRGPGGGTTLLRRTHVRHIKAVHSPLDYDEKYNYNDFQNL